MGAVSLNKTSVRQTYSKRSICCQKRHQSFSESKLRPTPEEKNCPRGWGKGVPSNLNGGRFSANFCLFAKINPAQLPSTSADARAVYSPGMGTRPDGLTVLQGGRFAHHSKGHNPTSPTVDSRRTYQPALGCPPLQTDIYNRRKLETKCPHRISNKKINRGNFS